MWANILRVQLYVSQPHFILNILQGSFTIYFKAGFLVVPLLKFLFKKTWLAWCFLKQSCLIIPTKGHPEQSVVSSDLHSKETNQDLIALAVQPAGAIQPPLGILGMPVRRCVPKQVQEAKRRLQRSSGCYPVSRSAGYQEAELPCSRSTASRSCKRQSETSWCGKHKR